MNTVGGLVRFSQITRIAQINTVGGFVRFSQMNTDVHRHRFGRVINRFIHLRADQAGAGTICTGKRG
jgi:hypothetical protein